jgi:hypothetical protein
MDVDRKWPAHGQNDAFDPTRKWSVRRVEIVGAVGVSGTPVKDDDCSQAGIDKAADQLK